MNYIIWLQKIITQVVITFDFLTPPDCWVDVSVLVAKPAVSNDDCRHISVKVGVTDGVGVVHC